MPSFLVLPPALRRPVTAAWWVLVAAVLLYPIYGANVYWVGVLTEVVVYACLALGLNVVVGFAGLMDLGYAAFAAVGAYSWGILATKYNLNLLESLPFVLAFALAGGLVVALPTLRLRRDYLAIVTLAFGLMVQVIANNLSITGGATGIYGIPPVSIAGVSLSDPESVYVGLLVTLVIFLAITVWVRRSRLGLRLRSLRDDESAAEAIGINTYRYKTYAYLIGALAAAIVGIQYASSLTAIAPTAFDINLSIYVLVAVILGGSGSIFGPVVGAAMVAAVPELLRQYEIWGQLAFGAILVATVILKPDGLAALGRQLVASDHRTVPPSPGPDGDQPAAATAPLAPARRRVSLGEPLLTVEELTVRFGGVVAVDGISFEVSEDSEPLGIIGPNGAGKTTLFNGITGYARVTSGEVLFGDRRITGKRPSAISGLGLRRTFQHNRLFKQMSVLDNVLAAAPGAGNRRLTAERALNFVGLGRELHGLLPTELAYGQQKRVEIARAVVDVPALLFLDEPAAGLNPAEKAEIAEIIAVIHRAGVQIVVIDHDVALIAKTCGHIVCMDFGSAIAEGTPAEVVADPAVVEAYLGSRTAISPGAGLDRLDAELAGGVS